MAEINSDYWGPLNNALENGTPCLVGTVSADGKPEISPKGSIVVMDAGTVAHWERSHRGNASNIQANPQVVIYYRNPDQAESLPQGAALRLYGAASAVADQATNDKIYDMIPEREQKADSGKNGHAVVVQIDRVTNLRGDAV